MHEQIDELTTQIETLDQKDVEGKPIGSGWMIISINKLAIDMFETKPLRGSIYTTTPEKYANAKCGLINIRNDDEECFRRCMLHHQSKQDNI